MKSYSEHNSEIAETLNGSLKKLPVVVLIAYMTVIAFGVFVALHSVGGLPYTECETIIGVFLSLNSAFPLPFSYR